MPIRLDVLQCWLGDDAEVVGVGQRVPLKGGRTAPVVERVSIRCTGNTRSGTYAGDSGTCAGNGRGGGRYARAARGDIVEVVAKRATPGELAVLSCLDVVDPVFPPLIDSGVDEGGPWIVVPFEGGGVIGWTAEPPASVYAALARLHLRHLGRTDELSAEIPRVDEGFLRSSFTGFAAAGVATAARRGPHAVYDRALELLGRFAEDERLLLGLAVLPVTLIHGDVYGDNVIAADPPAAGVPRLIDWGSARVGPPMLDVVMAGRRAGRLAYQDAWASVAGTPMDEWLAATGEAWATAVNNATFVGATAERSVDVAEFLLDEAEEAIDRLGRQLGRGR